MHSDICHIASKTQSQWTDVLWELLSQLTLRLSYFLKTNVFVIVALYMFFKKSTLNSLTFVF